MHPHTLTLTLALFVPFAATAAPPVWNTVPDTDFALEGMEAPGSDEAGDVIQAENGIDRAKTGVQDAKDARADSRREALARRADVFAARVDLWRARRTDDPTEVEAAEQRVDRAQRDLEAAEQHVAWHRADVAQAKDELKLARTEARLEVAELELTQAEALHDEALWSAPFHPVARYERQVERLEDQRIIDASEVAVSSAATSEARATWTWFTQN